MFTQGQALNDAYGSTLEGLFALNPNLLGVPVPDMRQFGNRYADLLASESGRNKFVTQVGWANKEMRDDKSGIYKPGDLDMLKGLSFDDPYTQANYDSLYARGNSYFLPDALEVNPWEYAYGYLSKDRPALENEDIYNRFSGGQRLAGTWSGKLGVDEADQQIQNLLSYRNNGKDYAPHQPFAHTNDGFSVANNPYYQARGVLAGMDVARGDLTTDQGDALTRATEFQSYSNSSNQEVGIYESLLKDAQNKLANLKVDQYGNTDTYEQTKQSLTNQVAQYQTDLDARRKAAGMYGTTLGGYMNTVNTIDPTKKLSSGGLLNALR